MRRILVLMAALSISILALPVVPAHAGGFCTGYMEETYQDASGTRVRMSKNCFSPTVIRVASGDTVTFVNADPEIHAVGGAAGTFGDAHGEIVSGDKVSYRFDEEGVFPYACIFHPGMAGAVVVGDGMGSKSAAVGSVAVEEEPPAERPATRPVAGEAAESSSVPWGVGLGIAIVLLAAAIVALARRPRPHEAATAP